MMHLHHIRADSEFVIIQRFEPGDNKIVWDGRTDKGTQAASGVYFIRIETRLGAKVARAVMLK